MIIFHTNGRFYWCCRFFLLFPVEQYLYKSSILYSLKGFKAHTIKFPYKKNFWNCNKFILANVFAQLGIVAIICFWWHLSVFDVQTRIHMFVYVCLGFLLLEIIQLSSNLQHRSSYPILTCINELSSFIKQIKVSWKN